MKAVSSETSVKRKSELNLPGGAEKTKFAQGDVDQVPFAKRNRTAHQLE